MKLAAKIAAIEFVGDEVRLAVIKTGGRLPKVLELHTCLASYDAPEKRHEALVEAVKTVADRMETQPAAYVLCLSSFHSVVRSLTIPFKGRRVAGAVRFELERYLAFPIEELVVDFFPVLEVEGQTEVLAIGVRREVLSEQLEILAAAGIEAEGANVDAVGLTGLWRDSRPDLKGLNAVLHAREEGSILAVVNGKSPVYFRHLGFTADELHSAPQAAAQQVQNSLRAFHAGWKAEGKIASLTVTGHGFTDEAQYQFARGFDVPVAYEDMLTILNGAGHVLIALEKEQGSEPPATPPAGPLFVEAGGAPDEEAIPEAGEISPNQNSDLQEALFQKDDVRPAVPGRPCNGWEAAVGVATCAGGGAVSLNFRKDDLAPKNVLMNVLPKALITACLVVLLLLSVTWHFMYARSKAKGEIDRLTGEIAQLQQEVEALQNQGISVGADTFSQPTLIDILNEIAARVPDDKASISRLTINPPGSSQPWIILQGTGTDASAQVLADLKQSSMFTVEEPDFKLEGGKTTFTVKAYHNKPSAGDQPAPDQDPKDEQ